MSEKDALSTFDFNQVTPQGVYLRWEPGVPVVMRILTIDPVMYTNEYTDRQTDELVLNTKFAFTIYNFSASKAQIMQATPNTAKKIGDLHNDPDFGANIRAVDVKITPPNKGEIKAYDVAVLPNTRELTNEQINEARAINLEETLAKGENNKHIQRMSTYTPASFKEEKSGYTQAKDVANKLGGDVVAGVDDGPINLDDIPF